MSRGINNWTFNKISKFLLNQDFSLSHTKGSHYFYTKITNDSKKIVCIPRHNNKTIHPTTFNSIIKQSGIDKKTWLGL